MLNPAITDDWLAWPEQARFGPGVQPPASLTVSGREVARTPSPPPQDHPDTTLEDGYEASEDEVDISRLRVHYPISEDRSLPSSDELRVIQQSPEQSALDDKHWRDQTFSELDSQLTTPGECGTVQWTIEHFNGTKDMPNKKRIMRSPTVSIGGHDWRINLVPRGTHETDRMSVYIENISVGSSPEEVWDPAELPLPLLESGRARLVRTKGACAQVSVLVYNPNEPRVYTFKRSCHRFSRSSPDHGWTRLSDVPWYDLQRRQWGQRQPLLQHDRIAVKAFIRIIDDASGCLWAPITETLEDANIAATSLIPVRPFDAAQAVLALWLHLKPMRVFVSALNVSALSDTKIAEAKSIVQNIQNLLYCMRQRNLEDVCWPQLAISHHVTARVVALDTEDAASHVPRLSENDAIETMDVLQRSFVAVTRALHANGADITKFESMLTVLFGHPSIPQFGSERKILKLTASTDMQDLIAADSSIDNAMLHHFELGRQTYNESKRCWQKSLAKVTLNDTVCIQGKIFVLYGFITHAGHLDSNRYQPYFRPDGLNGLWYTYSDFSVRCMSREEAVSPHEGSDKVLPYVVPDERGRYFARNVAEQEAVAYLVIYIRQDAFEPSRPETWYVPQQVIDRTQSNKKNVAEYSTSLTRWFEDCESFQIVRRQRMNSSSRRRVRRWDTHESESNASGSHEGSRSDSASDDNSEGGDASDDDSDADVEMSDEQGYQGTEQAVVVVRDEDSPPALATSTNDQDTTVSTDAMDISMASIKPSVIHESPSRETNDPVLQEITSNYFSQVYYKGTVHNNLPHGKGHLIYSNGNVYTGSFFEGRRDGHGSMTYRNGDNYTGNWSKGRYDGEGMFTEAATGNKHTGNWQEGKRYGEGITYWKVSEEEKRLCRICFEAEADAAFYDCGHVVACKTCADRCEDCPVCRKEVRDVIKIYL